MIHKVFFIDDYEFVLDFFDKEMLEQLQEQDNTAAFVVNYIPKVSELDNQTDKIMDYYEKGFLKEINAVINENPEWYERFELPRRFNREGWTGYRNSFSERVTLTAHRTILLKVKEN